MQNRHRFTGRKVCDLSFVFSERVQGGPAFITYTAGEHGDHVTQEPVMHIVSCVGTTWATTFKYQLLEQRNEDPECMSAADSQAATWYKKPVICISAD
jgi:hypothetical protein